MATLRAEYEAERRVSSRLDAESQADWARLGAASDSSVTSQGEKEEPV
jgi:hypothetical protein